jgi:hypothetical protein
MLRIIRTLKGTPPSHAIHWVMLGEPQKQFFNRLSLDRPSGWCLNPHLVPAVPCDLLTLRSEKQKPFLFSREERVFVFQKKKFLFCLLGKETQISIFSAHP